MQSYRLIVEGKVLDGFDPQQVREQVAQVFKLQDRPDKLDRLFGGKDVVAKHSLDAVQMERYITALHELGLACRSELEPKESPASVVVEEDSEPPQDSIAANNPQRVPLSAGLSWIKEGFHYFKGQPLHWIGIIVVMMLIYMALSMLWIMEIFSAVISCLMSGGLMIACYKQLQGDRFTVGTLFDGFRYKFKPLAILGLLFLLLCIIAFIVSVIIFAIVMGVTDFESLLAVSTADTSPLTGVVLMLLIMLVWLPLMMMSWFSPALVSLNGEKPWRAMVLSLKGAWRNIWSLSIYGLVMIVLSVVASLPVFLGWLVLLPMIYTTQFVAYREIFCESVYE